MVAQYRNCLWLALLLGCGKSGEAGESDCQPGAALCECLDGLRCDDDLVCIVGICAATGPGTGTGTGGAPTTGGTDPSAGESGKTGSSGVEGSTDGSGGVENGSPVIVEFGADVSSLTQGESVVFTAKVTDPDGLDDIQGGALQSEDGTVTYGAFLPGGDGVYTLELSWTEMHAGWPIYFDGGESKRGFRAEFSDKMGLVATQATEIGLTCAGGCASAGICPNTQIDQNHCGTCGNRCPVGSGNGSGVGGCAEGKCKPHFSECVQYVKGLTCDGICFNYGQKTCAADQCGGKTTLGYGTLGVCNDWALGGGDNVGCGTPMVNNVVRCCCTD